MKKVIKTLKPLVCGQYTLFYDQSSKIQWIQNTEIYVSALVRIWSII